MEEDVCFLNKNREKISGKIFTPSKTGKYPAIVFCHGFTSSKYTKIGIAKSISRKGFVVFIFDASGSGESQGRFEDHTITKYVGELGSAVDFIKTFDFVDSRRIGVTGHSLGGMIVAIYASKYKVDAVIPIDAPCRITRNKGSDSPFSDPELLDVWKNRGYMKFSVRRKADRKIKKLSYDFVQDSMKYDLSKIAKKIRCPVVIVQGDADKVVPPEHARILFASAKEPKKLIFVKGVNHRYNGKDKKILEEILVREFSKYLR